MGDKDKAVRIAMASSDGKMINRHFGHTDQFYIAEIKDKQLVPLEIRSCQPYCNFGTHDDSRQDVFTMLADCDLVLVVKIGEGAQTKLEEHGPRAVQVTGFIDDCLEELLKNL
ncbi:MAG: dinitrogenase iron-molybdenum cofactor biosynthesis protein [Peptococcaceae bacterium]|jgi:predicted Fe-Mo cluster-binding NifX family protein|nr:dinitrogenase iron-molybdenum cofactor biosynthesis protein [Peptococcaceae bacterium]